MHIQDFTFTGAELFHDHANKLFGNVHRELFDRLHQLAIHAPGNDLRLTNHQLIAFAAHHLYKDGKLKLATAHDFKGVGAAGLFHSQ